MLRLIWLSAAVLAFVNEGWAQPRSRLSSGGLKGYITNLRADADRQVLRVVAVHRVGVITEHEGHGQGRAAWSVQAYSSRPRDTSRRCPTTAMVTTRASSSTS